MHSENGKTGVLLLESPSRHPADPQVYLPWHLTRRRGGFWRIDHGVARRPRSSPSLSRPRTRLFRQEGGYCSCHLRVTRVSSQPDDDAGGDRRAPSPGNPPFKMFHKANHGRVPVRVLGAGGAVLTFMLL